MKNNKIFTGVIEYNGREDFSINCNEIPHTIHLKEPSLKYFNNDHVEFFINNRRRKGKYLATVNKLLKEKKHTMLGVLQKKRQFFFCHIGW